MLPFFMLRLERDGDRERFARLYQAAQRPLHRLAARLLGPGPRAEDVVDNTFIKFIQNYGQLRARSDGELERWLMAVGKNTALDMLRRDGHETELESGVWEPAAPPDLGEFEALVVLIRALPEVLRRRGIRWRPR